MVARGVFRRLLVFEREKVQRHLLRLEREDRIFRFAGYVSDGQIEAYCQGLDWSRASLIGYLVDGEVRGLGELKPLARSWPRSGEAAFSVERRFQDRGVGTELLRRLIAVARNRSIRSLHMLCLPQNGKVVRIARKLGARIQHHPGEVDARLALRWPNHLTLLWELVDSASAIVDPGSMRTMDRAAAAAVTPLGQPAPAAVIDGDGGRASPDRPSAVR